VERWKFICILFSIFLMLETVDVATTIYGIKVMGLVEDNPSASDIMKVKGLEGGLISMVIDNVGLVLLLVLLSNRNVGPLFAVILLGAFSLQFLPTAVNNLCWIYLNMGLYYEQIMPVGAACYMLGGLFTILYMNSIGDLDNLIIDLKDWVSDKPILASFLELD
jgi:hypothetical protein